jgi:hypothetical protein
MSILKSTRQGRQGSGLAIAAIFMAFSLFGGASAQISNPEGKLKPVPADKIWPQTLRGSHFNEFWNYQFYLNDGIKLHIIYSAANFGSLKSPVSGVRVSVQFPNENSHDIYQLAREYPIDRLVQDHENFRLSLREDREIYFEGKLPETHRLRINTRKDGVNYDLDLSLSNITRGYTRGNGIFTVRDEEIGIYTHIPYAEVSGYVNVNNNRMEVNGTAYMDHTWQYQTTTRLMHSGYRFVSHQDAGNWDLLYFMLPEDGRERRTIGYRLYKRDGKIRQAGIERITQVTSRRVSGRQVALTLEVELDNGERVRITRSEDEEVFSVLGELGWVARRAARTFLGGEVVDIRGTAHFLEDSALPKTGHYNFFIID